MIYDDLPINIAIFHSYVKQREGMSENWVQRSPKIAMYGEYDHKPQSTTRFGRPQFQASPTSFPGCFFVLIRTPSKSQLTSFA